MQQTIANGAVSACCQDTTNLAVTEDTEKVTIRQCRVCGRRHFRAKMDALDLRASAAPLGG